MKKNPCRAAFRRTAGILLLHDLSIYFEQLRLIDFTDSEARSMVVRLSICILPNPQVNIDSALFQQLDHRIIIKSAYLVSFFKIKLLIRTRPAGLRLCINKFVLVFLFKRFAEFFPLPVYIFCSEFRVPMRSKFSEHRTRSSADARYLQ